MAPLRRVTLILKALESLSNGSDPTWSDLRVGKMSLEIWDQLGGYCRNPVKEWQRHELQVLVLMGTACVGRGGSVSGSRCYGDRLKKDWGVLMQHHWAESPASYGQSGRLVAFESWTRLGILEWCLTKPQIELYWKWLVNSNLMWEWSQRSSTHNHQGRNVNRAQDSRPNKPGVKPQLTSNTVTCQVSFFISTLPGRPPKIPLLVSFFSPGRD